MELDNNKIIIPEPPNIFYTITNEEKSPHCFEHRKTFLFFEHPLIINPSQTILKFKWTSQYKLTANENTKMAKT